jgi:type I restriction enzyme, S subunit
VRLVNIVDLVSDGVEPGDAEHLVYVGLEHIDSGIPTLSRTGSPLQVRSRKTVFRRGDVLYGKLRPYLDKAVLVDMDGMCSTDILVLRPKPDTDPEFLVSLLHTDAFIRHAAATTAGVNHPRTSWPAIREFELDLPPLSEQRDIAHVLRSVQRARETTELVIAAARELKRSMSDNLFRRGTRSREGGPSWMGFESVPEEWSVERVADVCQSVTVGIVVRPASYYVQSGVPALRSLNIREDRIERSNLVFIDPVAHRTKLGKSRLFPGDVLVVRTGYPGTSAVVPDEFDDSNCIDLVIVRPNASRVLSEYLSTYFNSPLARAQFMSARTGMAQQHLNVRAVKATLVPIPPLNEQAQVVAALASIERKVLVEEQRRDALDAIFGSLLKELMTGGMRISDFAGVS